MALSAVVAVPPFLFVWLIIHPFAHKWRELGAAKTYSIAIVMLIALMALIFLFREPLLRIRFGASRPLAILAVPFFLAAIYLGTRIVWRLRPAALLGLPEISAQHYPGRLVIEGIYAHLRHPRYVQVGLALAAIALFCNYLAGYVLFAAYFALIHLVVFFEERELKQRFGEKYERYCREVPRFIPRFPGRKRPTHEL